MSDAPASVSSRGSSRRSFLISIGATVIGRFALPDVPAGGRSNTPPPSDAADQLRGLLTRPVWNDNVPNTLCWLEKDSSDGEVRVMCWHLETEAELADRVS